MGEYALELSELIKKIKTLQRNIEKVIQGKPETVKSVIVGLIAQGHILIEDMPGVGKTTLAGTLAKSTALAFKKIQFTSDLLPSDILGVSIFDQKSGEFNFKPGPVFANVVLADEINRATPKTQSALLEAMSEGCVTVDGVSRELPKPFMVVATQNPFEYKGTFPLPENQLDRFSMRISVGYPSHESEKAILQRQSALNPSEGIHPVISRDEVSGLQAVAEKVRVDDSLLDYILAIVGETRNLRVFELGVSPRGAIALKLVAQAHAIVEGRMYCIPDDIKRTAVSVLAHRVVLKNGRSFGRSGGEEQAVREALERVRVPV
ncbi:MAG: AAA family ATPase [Deltaproteobacteria bacterium]